MVKVKWTKRAIEDIYQIREYFSETSLRYAENLTDMLFEKGEMLTKHPRMGRAVPEFNNPEIREVIFKNYRIIYQIDDNKLIRILTIHHSFKPLSDKSIFD